jgi:hypothetical protein
MIGLSLPARRGQEFRLGGRNGNQFDGNVHLSLVHDPGHGTDVEAVDDVGFPTDPLLDPVNETVTRRTDALAKIEGTGDTDMGARFRFRMRDLLAARDSPILEKSLRSLLDPHPRQCFDRLMALPKIPPPDVRAR